MPDIINGGRFWTHDLLFLIYLKWIYFNHFQPLSGKRSNQTCTLMVSYGKGAGLIKINQILRWKRKYPNWRQVDVVGTDVPKFCYSGKHNPKIFAQLRSKEKQFWSFQLLPVCKIAWKYLALIFIDNLLLDKQSYISIYHTIFSNINSISDIFVWHSSKTAQNCDRTEKQKSRNDVICILKISDCRWLNFHKKLISMFKKFQ